MDKLCAILFVGERGIFICAGLPNPFTSEGGVGISKNKMVNQPYRVRDFRNKQFFQVDDEYLNGYARICGVTASAVYMALCRHANKSQEAWPSKQYIAKEIGASERSVYTGLLMLEKWQIIAIKSQGRKHDGSFKNLTYCLLDKSMWKTKPSANPAVGKKQPPRRQYFPNKDTQYKKDTQNGASRTRLGKTLTSEEQERSKLGIYPR